ncbi:MAG: chain length determinant protein EpsF [Rhodocyclaceae bacterium]
MTPAQFLQILFARKWLLVGVASTIVVLTMIYSFVLPKQYSAAATILVDAKGIDPITGLPTQAALLPSFMSTQIDILKSDRVARRVIRLLKLDQVPGFKAQWQDVTGGKGSFDKWLADMVIQRLEVKPSRESNVFQVEFTWPDPTAAAAFANTFAQAYIDTNVELRVEPAKQYASFFMERTKTAREELEVAQKRLSDYQREHGIVATDERLDIETNRLNELSTQLVGIQSVRIDSASRQFAASNKENMAEVLQNPLVTGLKSDLARMETQRDELSKRLGKNHPEYLKVETEIAGLRDKVEVETAKVIASIGTSNRVNVQREGELRAALEVQKKKVLELKQQRDDVSVLQNEVVSAQRTLDTINQRFTQTNLESQTQQTNIILLNAAVEPIRHSSPRKFLNLILSMFFGTFLGVAAVLLAETVRQARSRNCRTAGHSRCPRAWRDASRTLAAPPVFLLVFPSPPVRHADGLTHCYRDINEHGFYGKSHGDIPLHWRHPRRCRSSFSW